MESTTQVLDSYFSIAESVSYDFCMCDSAYSILFCFVYANKFSDAIIARWEANSKRLISEKSCNLKVLKTVLKLCGLSPGKDNVYRLRVLLMSLKTHHLPKCPVQVKQQLTDVYHVDIKGE